MALNPLQTVRAVQVLPTRFRLVLPDLIRQLLPSLLRRPRLLALLQSWLSPLETRYREFSAYYFTTRRELSYNGQTMVLERALNDRFDPAFRRIRLTNTETELEPLYLNFVAEQQPLPAVHFVVEAQPPLYMRPWVEYINQVGFTVRVPRSLAPQELALQARIKQLKLALIRHTLLYTT